MNLIKYNSLIQFHIQDEFSAKGVDLKASLGQMVHLKRRWREVLYYGTILPISLSWINSYSHARINSHLHWWIHTGLCSLSHQGLFSEFSFLATDHTKHLSHRNTAYVPPTHICAPSKPVCPQHHVLVFRCPFIVMLTRLILGQLYS